MSSLYYLNSTIVTQDLKFNTRSGRKLLTTQKYVVKGKNLTKKQNTPVMFVRAPKHFKRGKQHVFFFSGIYKKRIILKSSYPIIFYSHPQLLFKIFNIKNQKTQRLCLQRLTLRSKFLFLFKFSFNGWSFVFSINNQRCDFFFYFFIFNIFLIIYLFE